MSGARGCFNCGGFGHQAANCPKAGTPTCYNCGGEGHVSRDCSAPAKASLATSAARKVTSPATAPRPPLLLEDSAAAVDLALSATSAERSATSLVLAPRLPLGGGGGGGGYNSFGGGS
ncbi:hypothetical protein BDZ97DRAFT_1804522, partial [Flammula alnicola]